MPDSPVISVIDGAFATITLNRPDKLNAMTHEMLDIMSDELGHIRSDSRVRCLVLRGAGKSFCAGDDLRRPAAHGVDRPSLDVAARWSSGHVRVVADLLRLRIPTLAVLSGHVLGAGLDLALGCDFRLCTPTVQIGTPVVKHGLAGAGVYLLMQNLGLARATKALLLGESFSAAEALALGLVTDVVTEAELETELEAWRVRLGTSATAAIGAIKAARNQLLTAGIVPGLEQQLSTSLEIQFTEDAAEGRAAWRERRSPQFTGQLRRLATDS